MIGYVDESARALLEISVGKEAAGTYLPVMTWIDTAFDGHLVFSNELISTLDLEPLIETEALLADGSKVELETFLCYVDWFDRRIPAQVIGNDGKLPLLGTALLDGRVLNVDYLQKELTLN